MQSLQREAAASPPALMPLCKKLFIFFSSLNRYLSLADTFPEVMNMSENPYTSPEMKEYFSTLPSFIQESIEQSGMKFEDLSHLRSFVDNIEKRD